MSVSRRSVYASPTGRVCAQAVSSGDDCPQVDLTDHYDQNALVVFAPLSADSLGEGGRGSRGRDPSEDLSDVWLCNGRDRVVGVPREDYEFARLFRVAGSKNWRGQ